MDNVDHMGPRRADAHHPHHTKDLTQGYRAPLSEDDLRIPRGAMHPADTRVHHHAFLHHPFLSPDRTMSENRESEVTGNDPEHPLDRTTRVAGV